MKRLFAWLLDQLFFLSFSLFIGLFVIGDIYYLEGDISTLSMLLQTQLLQTLLISYVGLFFMYSLYFVFIPSWIGGTIGQRLIGLKYDSIHGVTLTRIFIKVIIGRFWDLLLFPVTIFTTIKKKDSISAKISSVVLIPTEEKNKKGFFFLTLFFSLVLIAMLGAGTYVYRAGINPIMESLTDYERQLEKLVDIHALEDAKTVLVKYEKYNGKDSTYDYYNCIIEGNTNNDIENLSICEKSLSEINNEEQKVEILMIQARILAANNEYPEAAAIYDVIWNKYNIQTAIMNDYVIVLSELGESEKAETILTGITKQADMTDIETAKKTAELYERIGAKDKALEIYEKIIEDFSTEDYEAILGEIHYYAGVILYSNSKYEDAKMHFEITKESNKDFAEAAVSYIILISDLSKSITK